MIAMDKRLGGTRKAATHCLPRVDIINEYSSGEIEMANQLTPPIARLT